MGRFYKTAKSKEIDYGFRLPLQHIASAVSKIDTQIDTTISQNEAIKTYLNSQEAKSKKSLGRGMYLDNDTESYKSEIDGFQTEIDDISTTIMKNPMDSYQQNSKISDLRTRIQSSMTTGNLSVYQSNLNSAQDFMKKNKDVDPMLVNAAFTKSKDDWKKSIDDEGNYRMLSDYLPPTLYDVDIEDKALKTSRIVNKDRPTNERRNLIFDSISTDGETRATVGQQLEYGLLRDLQGEVIDGSDLDDVEKNKIINAELQRIAIKAEDLTHKPYKAPTSSSSSKDDTYKPASSGLYPEKDGTGILTNNSLGDAINIFNRMNPGEDGNKNRAKASLIGIERHNRIINGNYAQADKYRSSVDKSILENNLKKAKVYAEGQVSLGTNNEIWKDSLATEEQKLGFFMEQYLQDKKLSTELVNTISQWSGFFSETEQKKIEAEVDAFIGRPLFFNDIVIESPNEEINGKSINTLIANGTLNYKFINEDRYKKAKETIDELEEDEYQKGSLKVTDNKNVYSYEYIDANKTPQKATIVKEYDETKYKEFEMSNSKPVPTVTTDSTGNISFMKTATFKGKQIGIYINEKNALSGTYTAFKDGKEDRNKAYNATMNANSIYNKIESSRLEVGDTIQLSSTETIVIDKNEKITLQITGYETEPITDRRQIIDYLKIVFDK